MKLHRPVNRLIAALLLLAAPLAVAAWGLGGYAAQRARNSADTRLVRSLGSADNAYRNLLSQAGATASRKASRRQVQLGFLRGGPPVLAWRMSPTGAVTRWRGAVPPAAASRKVDVLSKGRKVGEVVVFLPFDRALARRLTGSAGLEE